MTNKTSPSRGEIWGIKAAHGTKWFIRKLKAFDKHCVTIAKKKNWPGWLGHTPLGSITLTVIAFLAYFSPFILFIVGVLILLWGTTNGCNISFSNDSYNSDNISEQDEYDGFQNGSEGLGYYMGGFKIDDDEEDN